MTQLASPMMPEQNPMKKKVIATISAVVIGHLGIMWALSHVKTLEIKNEEKPAMSVRFVQIKPEPVEPKPIVEPIPEPQVKVEPKVEPKVIAQKQKPVEQKVVQKEEVKEKKKVEPDLTKQREQEQQKMLEQQRQQQLQKEQAEQQRREAEQREAERRAQELNTPKKLSIGQISWSRSPKPVYTNRDLQGSNRTVIVAIDADAKGNITNVSVVKSSGIAALDQKIVRAVKGAKFKPYKENGIAYPFKAEQPFELTLNSNG